MSYPTGYPNAFPNPHPDGTTYRVGPEKREGDVTLSLKGGEVVVEETYSRLVVSPDKNHTRLQVLNGVHALGLLPIPGRNMSPSGLGVCAGTTLTRNPNNVYHWDMVIKYSSRVTDDLGQNQSYDGKPPTAWVPQWQSVIEPYDYAADVDFYGKPYTNGSGQMFVNPPMQKKYIIRWDFAQFYAITVTEKEIADRNETTNSVAFVKGGSTWPIHSLRCTVRSITTGWYYGVALRLVEYSVAYKEDLWVMKLRNVGDMFVDADNEPQPYMYKPKRTGMGSPMQKNGWLGSRDVPLNTDFIAADGRPTGGIVFDNGIPYANRPTQTKPFTIARMPLKPVDFRTFLRSDVEA